MPSLFKVNELDQRKQRLVQQSEIYREMMRRDVQNIGLATSNLKKKASWLPVAAAALGLFAWRRRSKASPTPVNGIASMVGKELLRNVLPIGGGIIARRLFDRRK